MTQQTYARMTAGQGTALLVGAVLGPGMLVLPYLAASAAGPASVLAWAGLLALSVPVALTFAALGARYPDGGGVASFVGLAFGRRASAVTGWWFFGAVPIGTVAGALVGGQYVEACFGVDGTLAAWLIMIAAFAANAAGLRTSGLLQIGFVVLLVGLLAAAVISAAPHADPANFTPFAPHGMAGVASAAGVLMFAFVGWEAASHLSAEFADRANGLVRATVATLAVITVLYVGVSVTSVAVLGADMTEVPLSAMLALGLGDAARPVTGVVAVLLTFGAVNTYLAGAARLGAALARDGALPGWFASGGEPGRTPYRSLGLLAVLCLPVLVWAVDLDLLMRATSACLAAVTAAGVVAAVRMLPAGRHRTVAVVGAGLSLAALGFCGVYLVVPAVLALVAAAVLAAGSRRPQKKGI
ncbi:amino acid exporter (AAE family) [Nonomuraea polychroma]|uniref:Amino acid exporter (AAE family) n=1 Tax=Nonomuraea polychroma TaxID=46176 RepID=A0A438MN19_9ACTN|nr:amino acid permease [Nonomuraea polychroma]RVX47061.1 amino acid exporter (AAE family) [Nonomuraea polychroma]